MLNNNTSVQEKWPQGKRCAVVISFDFNDIQGILSQVPAVAGREKTLSVWRYGTLRGIDRILALLAEKICAAVGSCPASSPMNILKKSRK